ncbi:MAG TPA: DUF2652 domain-containing protein [Candidatus Limnocylindria bacterium]|jgi:hypothetical protein
MLKEAERGCLVLADISGYTGFLADSELAHAQDVLRDLIQTVVGTQRPLLKLAKLEGDASFSYSLTDKPDGSALLDTLEASYFAFRRRLDAIKRATTCDCNACILIPGLNLKFVAHFGEFVRERMYGVEELTGTDVIVAHRLLKNDVTSVQGVAAYALLTDALVRAANLDPQALAFAEHRHAYEGIGEVAGWVHDLEPRWQSEQETRRVRVTAKAQLRAVEADIPATPQEVWAVVTDPNRRADFVPGVARVDEAPMGGRRGIGTTNHCVHGEGATLEEILDWRPFDYFTLKSTVPGIGSWVVTEEVQATDGGAHVAIRFQKPRSAAERAKLEQVLPAMVPLYEASLQKLRELLSAPAALPAPGR